jgi:hypothetical protein
MKQSVKESLEMSVISPLGFIPDLVVTLYLLGRIKYLWYTYELVGISMETIWNIVQIRVFKKYYIWFNTASKSEIDPLTDLPRRSRMTRYGSVGTHIVKYRRKYSQVIHVVFA